MKETGLYKIIETEPVTLAVTHSMVRLEEIPSRIQGLFDIVYKWLPTADVEQVGKNYAIYDQFTAKDMRVRVGFPVSQSFQGNGNVSCLQLEGGRAAYTRPIGPYDGLQQAHAALKEWIEGQSLVRAGVSFEVYGHWQEDESKRITDVYIILTG